MIRKRLAFALVAGGLVLGLAGAASAAPAPLRNGKNVLVGINFNDGPGSSDMTLLFQLSLDGKVVIDEGAACKYLDLLPAGPAPAAGWEKEAYDDSAWKDGISSVGFADNDDNTVTATGLIAIISRYSFDVSNAASVKAITLMADYDDAFVAYLNGVEIARSALMAAKGNVAGVVPPWDYTSAGLGGNHESSDTAAGKPNAARWAAAAAEKFNVEFTPPAVTAVKAKGKLAGTWASLKGKF